MKMQFSFFLKKIGNNALFYLFANLFTRLVVYPSLHKIMGLRINFASLRFTKLWGYALILLRSASQNYGATH